MGSLAAVILLLLVWGPLGTPRRLISLVVLTALAFAGLEVLRRQTVREFPDAVPGDAMSLRLPLPHAGDSVPGAFVADTKVDRLERLAALHDRGASRTRNTRRRRRSFDVRSARLGGFDETAVVPPGRAARPEAASSVAPVPQGTNAPRVLPSERAAHPGQRRPFRQTS